MHNLRILNQDEKVELSHDVKFDKTHYPGISMFNSADLFDPSQLFLEGLDGIEEDYQQPLNKEDSFYNDALAGGGNTPSSEDITD